MWELATSRTYLSLGVGDHGKNGFRVSGLVFPLVLLRMERTKMPAEERIVTFIGPTFIGPPKNAWSSVLSVGKQKHVARARARARERDARTQTAYAHPNTHTHIPIHPHTPC